MAREGRRGSARSRDRAGRPGTARADAAQGRRLGSLRQHVVDGGTQIKQQAATTYYRAADPTPLAGARPGAVVAVVAGCLAVGTGTYTCVEQGINPLTSLPGIGESAPERKASTPASGDDVSSPVVFPVAPDTPATPTPVEPTVEDRSQEPPVETPTSEPAPAPPSSSDSLSGLGGDPTPTPAPAPAPPATSTGGSSSGTTFGGL
jgi:hypothetical protein